MKAELNLTPEEFRRLLVILHDTAIDAEDDGRENSVESKVLWKVVRQLQAQVEE